MTPGTIPILITVAAPVAGLAAAAAVGPLSWRRALLAAIGAAVFGATWYLWRYGLAMAGPASLRDTTLRGPGPREYALFIGFLALYGAGVAVLGKAIALLLGHLRGGPHAPPA